MLMGLGCRIQMTGIGRQPPNRSTEPAYFSVYGKVWFGPASSTDRRNTRIKTFCRCFKSKRLAWPLI